MLDRVALACLFVLGFWCGGATAPAQDAPASRPNAGPAAYARPFPYPYQFPRIPTDELKVRRDRLAQAIGEGAAVLVSDEPPGLSSGSRYRPNHNLLYFTGVDTDFCAWLVVVHKGKIARQKLFLPKYDKQYEQWNGRRVVADDAAKALTAIDDIVATGPNGLSGGAMKPLEAALQELAGNAGGPVYLDSFGSERGKGLNLNPIGRTTRLREYLAAQNSHLEFAPLDGVMNDIRGVKSSWEVAQIREAARVTGVGFVQAMRQTRPGMWEFEFQGLMDHAFDAGGCTGVPYYPIAASGPNACVLHYTDNRRQMNDGELVLCDIAGEFGYYASDITRTFPANGKFTERQRFVYEAVLTGQAAAAAALKPGSNLMQLDAVCRKAMRDFGLKESYPHGLSHHVGLNVHDLGDAIMRPGMVITIEPGCYLKSEGFGVRIEDCYLVTETGSECLSASIPKTVEQIEALVGADFRAGR